MLLTEFVFESDNLEALPTDLASVDGTFSRHVVNFFMRVSIILNTGSHADHNTPRRVRSENQDGVVNRSELRVHCGLHFVPLVQLDGVLRERSTKRSGRVTVHAVAFGHLRLIVLAIRFNKTLDVS